MAIICRTHNLLFIMAPRTGCTALGQLVCDELEGAYLPPKDILGSDGRFILRMKHSTLPQLLEHAQLSSQEASKLFKFSCVRNPFDSLVSLYTKKRCNYQSLLEDPDSWVYHAPGYVDDMKFCQDHSFEEWVLKRFKEKTLKGILRPKRRSLSRKYTQGVDFVMRFERLQGDFDEVLRRAGVERRLEIPRLNVTAARKRRYREYYSDRARRIVEKFFLDDFRTYGYEF